MTSPHEQHGTDYPDAIDDCKPLGAFYGMFHGLVIVVLVGGLGACVVWAVTR